MPKEHSGSESESLEAMKTIGLKQRGAFACRRVDEPALQFARLAKRNTP
jgi:hypothetical protein